MTKKIHATFPDDVADYSNANKAMSINDETGFGWFNNFTSLARSISRRLPETIDGLADTISRSALRIMNEIAEIENEVTSSEKGQQVSNNVESSSNYSDENMPIIPLPWELILRTEPDLPAKFGEDKVLKQKIMNLTQDENNFVTPFQNQKDELMKKSDFLLDESRISLIRRLCQEDITLGAIHEKLIGRNIVNERVFWKNYFFHCNKLRDMRRIEILGYDDELDAELVERPPSSCTGFYPTGKLSSQASFNDGIHVVALDDYVVVNRA